MENNKYRNTNDIDDTEYRRMRKSEDSSYEYHEADAEDIDEANVDDGYPEAVEHDENSSVYDPWLTMTYGKKSVGIGNILLGIRQASTI